MVTYSEKTIALVFYDAIFILKFLNGIGFVFYIVKKHRSISITDCSTIQYVFMAVKTRFYFDQLSIVIPTFGI